MISENDIQHYYRIGTNDLIKLCNIAFVAGCNSYHDLTDFKTKEIFEKFVKDNNILPSYEGCEGVRRNNQLIEINEIENKNYLISLKDVVNDADDISHNKITHDDRWIDNRSLEHKTVDFFDQVEKINEPSSYKGILSSSALPSNFVTISSNEISENITISEMANKEFILPNNIELTINPSFDGKSLTITSSSKDFN
jgi:hypothetical protein